MDQRWPLRNDEVHGAGSFRARFTRRCKTVGAVAAIFLAYFMPVLKEWTRPADPRNTARTLQFTSANGLDSSPSFSPDGSSMVYTSDKSGHFELYVKQVASGGAEIQLTRDGHDVVTCRPQGSS